MFNVFHRRFGINAALQHGESLFNLDGRIGGDSSLSHRGLQYAQVLPDVIRTQMGGEPLIVSGIICSLSMCTSHANTSLLMTRFGRLL